MPSARITKSDLHTISAVLTRLQKLESVLPQSEMRDRVIGAKLNLQLGLDNVQVGRVLKKVSGVR